MFTFKHCHLFLLVVRDLNSVKCSLSEVVPCCQLLCCYDSFSFGTQSFFCRKASQGESRLLDKILTSSRALQNVRRACFVHKFPSSHKFCLSKGNPNQEKAAHSQNPFSALKPSEFFRTLYFNSGQFVES